MAKSKKYSADDIFDSSQFKQIASDFDLVIGKVEKFIIEIKDAANVLNTQLSVGVEKLNKINLASVDGIEKYLAAEKEQTKILQEKAKLDKAQIELETKKITLIEKQAAQQKRIAKDKEAAAKATQKEIDNQKKLDSAYNQLQQKLTYLNKRLSDLNTRKALGQKLTDKEIQQIQILSEAQKKYDGILKQVDTDLGKNQRRVGDYTESVKQAINESGIFNSQLGEMRNIFNVVTQGFQDAETRAQKFSIALKGIGLIALIGAIGSIKDLISNTGEGARELEKLKEKGAANTKGVFNDIRVYVSASLQWLSDLRTKGYEKANKEFKKYTDENTTNYDKLNKNIDEYIYKLNELRREQALLTKAQAETAFSIKDVTEDINDQTLSIQFRRQKEQELLNVQQKSLSNTLKNAQLENELERLKTKTLLIAQGVQTDLTKEEYDGILNNTKLYQKLLPEQIQEIAAKQAAERTAVLEYEDHIEDYKRLSRKNIDEQLEIDLEFIRNKKLTSKQHQQVLQAQADDEKTSIEQRKVALKEYIDYENLLSQKSLQTLQEGITKRLKQTEMDKGGDKSKLGLLKNINLEYVKQLDTQQKLEEFVKSLPVNDNERRLLLAEIRKIQDATLNTQQSQQKLDEDEVKMLERVKQLNLEIKKINEETKLDAIKNQIEIRKESEKNLEQNVSQNPFDFTSIEKRKEINKEINVLAEQQSAKEMDIIHEDYLQKKQIIEATIVDEQEKNAAIEKLNLETDLAIQKSNEDMNKAKRENDLEYQNFVQQTQLAQIKSMAKEVDTVLNYTGQAEQKKYDLINNNQQKQIDQNEKLLEDQRNRAELGLTNELAFRQEQADKLALQQRREQQRQEKMQEVLAYLKLFTGYAEQDPKTALPNTLRDMALMETAKILFANEGEEFVTADENTKRAFKYLAKGKDVVPAMLAEGERVVPKEANEKYYDALHAIHTGTFEEKYLPNYAIEKSFNGFSEGIMNNALLNGLIKETKQTNKGLKELKETIKNRPIPQFGFNNAGEFVEKQIIAGVTKVITHQRKRL